MAFKVTITILLACLVGIGGLVAYRQVHASHCAALEDAYLNGREESSKLIGWGLDTNDEAERRRLSEQQDRNSQEQIRIIGDLISDCGDEALDTAERKARQQLGY